jgi:hypothetical protein
MKVQWQVTDPSLRTVDIAAIFAQAAIAGHPIELSVALLMSQYGYEQDYFNVVIEQSRFPLVSS